MALSIWLQSPESRVHEPTLPAGPCTGVRRGSSKKSGQLLAPPSTKILPPHPLLLPWPDKPTLSRIPDPSRQLGLETMLSPRWLLREGGASGSGGWSGDGGGAGVRTHAPGGGSSGAEFPKENEPIQSQEGRGKNLVWHLTSGEEGGQGWELLIRFSPQLPLQQGLPGQPRKGDV